MFDVNNDVYISILVLQLFHCMFSILFHQI